MKKRRVKKWVYVLSLIIIIFIFGLTFINKDKNNKKTNEKNTNEVKLNKYIVEEPKEKRCL